MDNRIYQNIITGIVYRVRENVANENYSIISNRSNGLNMEKVKFVDKKNSFKTFDEAQTYLDSDLGKKPNIKLISKLPWE